jgi:hypothetical protein
MSVDCYIRREPGQQYDMVWQHTNDCLQSCHSGTVLGLSSFDAFGFKFLIMTFHIEDLPYLVCMLLFLAALSRSDVFRMQYDSNGAVKPFGYMDGPWVLHQKTSYANVVSTVFSDERLSRVILL